MLLKPFVSELLSIRFSQYNIETTNKFALQMKLPVKAFTNTLATSLAYQMRYTDYANMLRNDLAILKEELYYYITAVR